MEEQRKKKKKLLGMKGKWLSATKKVRLKLITSASYRARGQMTDSGAAKTKGGPKSEKDEGKVRGLLQKLIFTGAVDQLPGKENLERQLKKWYYSGYRN